MTAVTVPIRPGEGRQPGRCRGCGWAGSPGGNTGRWPRRSGPPRWRSGHVVALAYNCTTPTTATTCIADSPTCGDLISDFNCMNQLPAGRLILQIVPALIGAFIGAPVLARELETGTFRYAWTQGLERWRWTLAKLVSLAVVVTTAAGVFSLLFSWYYQPYLAAGQPVPDTSTS